MKNNWKMIRKSRQKETIFHKIIRMIMVVISCLTIGGLFGWMLARGF